MPHCYFFLIRGPSLNPIHYTILVSYAVRCRKFKDSLNLKTKNYLVESQGNLKYIKVESIIKNEIPNVHITLLQQWLIIANLILCLPQLPPSYWSRLKTLYCLNEFFTFCFKSLVIVTCCHFLEPHLSFNSLRAKSQLSERVCQNWEKDGFLEK